LFHQSSPTTPDRFPLLGGAQGMKSKGQKQNRSPITAIGEHLLSDNRLEELNYRCVPATDHQWDCFDRAEFGLNRR